MGWASGSSVMNEIIDSLVSEVPDPEVRKRVYKPVITALRNADWDTLDESMFRDEAFDAAARELGLWER